MKKLRVSTREIGSVKVFDLEGDPTQETLETVAWQIQKKIRRHRLQRVILNLQRLPELEPLGLRKLIAAFIRPQKSLIFGASRLVLQFLEATYLPRNVRICASEKEVAEDLGPFLLEREKAPKAGEDGHEVHKPGLGTEVERRRSNRMHVALPLELKVFIPGLEPVVGRAIATNISEGGLYAQYLDLEVAQKIETIDPLDHFKVEIHIFPSANFPEGYRLEGKIRRKDLNKKQLGLGLEFVAVQP